jgi:hypothetical protein
MTGPQPNSTVQTGPINNTDIDTIVPDRLKDLDYSVLEAVVDFQHRGSRCQVDRILSYLGAAIENEAITRGEHSEPSPVPELDAVDTVLDALESKYPAWFGNSEATAALESPVADDHLSKSDIEEAYFDGQFAPETHPVDVKNWTDQKRVLLPLLTIVLNRVREQAAADNTAAVSAAQKTIKKTIIREAIKHDLDEADLGVAFDAALQTLDRH